jgi:hypothetical protein
VEIINHSKHVLTDFRSKFNKKVSSLALSLKNKRLRDGKTSAPSRTEIDDFITQDVAKQTLS